MWQVRIGALEIRGQFASGDCKALGGHLANTHPSDDYEFCMNCKWQLHPLQHQQDNKQVLQKSKEWTTAIVKGNQDLVAPDFQYIGCCQSVTLQAKNGSHS